MARIGSADTLALMRRGFMLLGFVASVFVLAAALSGPIYLLVQAAAPDSALARESFSRYVSRIAICCAVAGLFPVARMLNVGWRDLGISKPKSRGIVAALALALVGLGLFVGLAFAFDARSWRPSVTGARLFRSALLAVGAAVFVSPIEELVFRGALFGLLRKRNRWVRPLIVSSLVFAIAHFMHNAGATNPVRWHTGFAVLGAMFVPEAGAQWLPQFINLALCGAILAWVYHRTGSLWSSIALHAGWIFWLKLANAVTVTAPAEAAVWGTRKLIDGWGATIALAVTAALVPLLARPTTQTPHEPRPAQAFPVG